MFKEVEAFVQSHISNILWNPEFPLLCPFARIFESHQIWLQNGARELAAKEILASFSEGKCNSAATCCTLSALLWTRAGEYAPKILQDVEKQGPDGTKDLGTHCIQGPHRHWTWLNYWTTDLGEAFSWREALPTSKQLDLLCSRTMARFDSEPPGLSTVQWSSVLPSVEFCHKTNLWVSVCTCLCGQAHVIPASSACTLRIWAVFK